MAETAPLVAGRCDAVAFASSAIFDDHVPVARGGEAARGVYRRVDSLRLHPVSDDIALCVINC